MASFTVISTSLTSCWIPKKMSPSSTSHRWSQLLTRMPRCTSIVMCSAFVLFFKKKYKFDAVEFPVLDRDIARTLSLDVELKASGCSKKEEELFEQLIEAKNDGLIPEQDVETDESEGDDVDAVQQPEEVDEDVSQTTFVCAELVESSDVTAESRTLSPTVPAAPSASAFAEHQVDEVDEGDEGEEPESERRRRLKTSGPKKQIGGSEVKEKVRRVVAGRQAKSKKVGSEAKRNTQKVGRNKTKRFIKNELRDTHDTGI